MFFEEKYNIDSKTDAVPSNNGGMNYVKDNNIFILDKINMQTIAPIMGDIVALVNKAIQSKSEKTEKEESINIYIDSAGGSTYQREGILHFMNLCKMNNLIVMTHVIGQASSAASSIAIMGSKGFRIMSENSFHFIHFGTVDTKITKYSEMKRIAQEAEKHHQIKLDMYLKNTNITEKQLLKLMESEMGYLTAEESLKLGFCDKVLTQNGYIER